MRKQITLRFGLMSGELAAAAVLGLLFLFGGALGCAVAGGVGGSAGMALEDYLRSYLALAKEQRIEVSFWAVVWERFQCPMLVFFSGAVVAGIFVIPILTVVRGFLYCYSVSCFLRLFGFSGLIPAGILFGLSAILWVPVFFVLATQGLCSSYSLLLRRTGERCDSPFCRWGYWIRGGVCAGVLVICIFFEALILPGLVGAAAGFVL